MANHALGSAAVLVAAGSALTGWQRADAVVSIGARTGTTIGPAMQRDQSGGGRARQPGSEVAITSTGQNVCSERHAGRMERVNEVGNGSAGPAAEEALPAHASAHLLSTSVSRLNRLRAAVLGCNDGITSTAGLVVGVAATHPSTTVLAVTGLSGLLAGSLSMGGGEFTSVRAARDSQDALLHIQRGELETIPHEELDELAHLYMQRGLSLGLARQVAVELTARDALAAHAEIELGIDLTDQVNPWEAAGASALSFLLGGVLSLLAILLPPAGSRIAVCVAVVLTALAGTGYLAARFGAAPTSRAAARNLTVGSLTMAITYALGALAQKLL